MSSINGKVGVALALCVGAGLLSACASPAEPTRMTAAANEVPPAAPGGPAWHALTVADVAGGSGTNPLFLSNVSDADLKTALTATLRQGAYLAESGAGTYQVSAHIMDLDKPTGSLDPLLWLAPVDWSATIKVRYVVAAPGKPAVFDEVVAATGVGDATSSAGSQGRVQRAIEAAVRADIQSFLIRLNTRWPAPASRAS